MTFQWYSYPWPAHPREPLSPEEYNHWYWADPETLEERYPLEQLQYLSDFYHEFDWRAEMQYWEEYGHHFIDWQPPNFIALLNDRLSAPQARIAAAVAILSLVPALRNWANQYEGAERNRRDDWISAVVEVALAIKDLAVNQRIRDLVETLRAPGWFGTQQHGALYHAANAIGYFLGGIGDDNPSYFLSGHGQTTWHVGAVAEAMESWLVLEREKFPDYRYYSSSYDEDEKNAATDVALANQWALGWWQAVQNVLAWRGAGTATISGCRVIDTL